MWGTNRHVAGFDGSGDTIKAVRVRCGRGRRPLLVDFALRDLSGPGSDSGLFRESGWGFRRGGASCSYPGRDIHIRQLDLPLQDDFELMASLPFEVRRHVPVSESADRVVAHQVLRRERERRRMSVLVVVAPSAEIESVRDRYLRAGVQPKRIEPAPLAAVNQVIHSSLAPDDGCWGVLDVGDTGSWLALCRKGGPLHVRSIHIGGASFTQELVLRCRLTRKEADRVKRAEVALGKIRPEWRSRTATLPTLLKNTIQGLASEVSLQLNGYRKKNGPVRALFLAGGGALVHGLDGVLGEKLGMTVRLADPFSAFDLPSTWTARKRDLLADLAPRFLVAVGLTRWWEH